LEADTVVARVYALAGQEAARVLIRLLQDFAYALENESATEQEKATARRLMGWLLSLSQHVENPEHLGETLGQLGCRLAQDRGVLG
jgi:hypothetical protein